MKFEKVLFKMSFKETLILSLFFFTGINGVVFLFLKFTGRPGFLVYDSAWIPQILFPFIYSIILTSINRNGVLKISDYNDLPSLIQKIESFGIMKGYIQADPKRIDLTTSESNKFDIEYIRKTKCGRAFNYFVGENINVKINKNEVLIFTKRNLLIQFITRLKYYKPINKINQAV